MVWIPLLQRSLNRNGQQLSEAFITRGTDNKALPTRIAAKAKFVVTNLGVHLILCGLFFCWPCCVVFSCLSVFLRYLLPLQKSWDGFQAWWTFQLSFRAKRAASFLIQVGGLFFRFGQSHLSKSLTRSLGQPVDESTDCLQDSGLLSDLAREGRSRPVQSGQATCVSLGFYFAQAMPQHIWVPTSCMLF